MRFNKVLMKIVVDVKLSLATIQGFSLKNVQLSKFALKLHKSI
jgi:hypothetical protein